MLLDRPARSSKRGRSAFCRSRPENRLRRGLAFAARRDGNALRLGAGAATIVDVLGILDEAVVHVVTDLFAVDADEVDALDRLVDEFAIEDASLQLLDADAEKIRSEERRVG